MQFNTIIGHKFFKPAIGSALAVLCGLALWSMPVGATWVNVSYDNLFRLGARPVTNDVALILMDNNAYIQTGQVRTQKWSRSLHAKLLNKLADDGCPLVVFDVFFEEAGDPDEDKTLAAAMLRQRQVVLVADQMEIDEEVFEGSKSRPPAEPFLSAARANWGVAKLLTNEVDAIVRQHWPFPSPGRHLSLPWRAAQLAGKELSDVPEKRWLRYYGHFYDPYCRMDAARTTLSYVDALAEPTNFFREKIVFIGRDPETPVPGDEAEDEFRSPFTRWTGNSAGGVKILATEYLNLVNGDWLRRPAWWMESIVLVSLGVLLGGGLCLLRPWVACLAASGAALAVMLLAVFLSYSSNYWFPWLVIAGGQLPCALAWSFVAPKVRRTLEVLKATVVIPEPMVAAPEAADVAGLLGLGLPVHAGSDVPDTPDYELFDPPFGAGAYGKVWLARNAIGQWQALKAVYLAKFGQNSSPYETEFKGIKRYKPVSEKHGGLLRVDFVSRKKPAGYFYYVMELGDALTPGWEEAPRTYKPRDLESVCHLAEGRRLAVRECVRIGVTLAEALDFLHRQGFTHRDIKPSNVIFVNNQPKLADVGLVTEIRPAEAVTSYAGTPGYMPPPPELPGTVQADIYALGMLFFVISTGRAPAFYPELTTSLSEQTSEPDFKELHPVIRKACQPDRAQRYASAAEMHTALLTLQKTLLVGAP